MAVYKEDSLKLLFPALLALLWPRLRWLTLQGEVAVGLEVAKGFLSSAKMSPLLRRIRSCVITFAFEANWHSLIKSLPLVDGSAITLFEDQPSDGLSVIEDNHLEIVSTKEVNIWLEMKRI